MKETMISWIMTTIMSKCDSEDLKRWADMGLDILEDKIASTPNKYDDMIVLPMIKLFRISFDIPDND